MTRHRIADLVTNSRLDVHWIVQALARVEKAGAAQGGAGADVAGATLDEAYLRELTSQIAKLKAQIAAAEADWRGVDANEFQRGKEALDKLSMRLHEVAIAQSLRGERGA
jgi:hypothetical protein